MKENFDSKLGKKAKISSLIKQYAVNLGNLNMQKMGNNNNENDAKNEGSIVKRHSNGLSTPK